jgi:hypothetical protein
VKRLVAIAIVLALVAPFAHADRIKFPQFALSATFTGFSIADTALTIYGTSHLGLREANPVMRPFLENRRYAALWAVQAAGCAGILAACHVLIHGDEKAVRVAGWALLVAFNVARGYIVIHNLRLHAQAR